MTLKDLYFKKYAGVIPDTQTMSMYGGKTENTYMTHDVPRHKRKAQSASAAYREELGKEDKQRPILPTLYLKD